MDLLKERLSIKFVGKYHLSSPFSNTQPAEFEAPMVVAENCSNGIDDDGDGFIDGADPDCGCLETVMMVARDNGQILSVNLATGGSSSVATSSPYVTGNLNALAANADKNLVYYCRDKKVYYWVPATGTHGQVFDLNGYIGSNESLSSGGGEYYGGYVYLGTENGNPGASSKIWRLQLSADGKSGVGAPVNLNVPIPTQLSWGDMIATAEGGHVIIYGMAAAGTSYFFRYNVNTTQYTLIRNDLPTEMQIGVDINGNTWAGSLSSGMIQKINRTTGYFYGNIINFGGRIWDLTGPINCPQSVEICGNNIDDDGDGLVDNQDQDCLCPTITPNDAVARTICEGETVTFNATSNAPNPPYSYIEYYRFDALQANPYLSTDAKTWLGEYANTNGTGTVSSNNFPNNTTSNTTYYVYGCVKPAPQYPATCAPLAAYTVVVKPAATLNAGSDVAICGGTSATLTALATNAPGPFNYTWSNGLGTGASKTVTPTSSSSYTVTVTAGNGCTTTDQVAIFLNPTPSVNAGADVFICNTEIATLTAVGSGGVGPYSFDWDNGLGSGAVKTVSPTSTKTYTVTITGSNGCVATDQVKVTVSNCVENCTNGIDDDGDGLVDCADQTCGITVESDSYFSICAGTPVSFTVSASGGSGVFTYVWDQGLGTGRTKTVTPLVSTNYTVTVTPSVGCTETKVVEVVVVNCPEDCTNGIDDDGDGLIDCADPDCTLVGAPHLVDDNYFTCPGTVYTDRVVYNDGNLQDPAYSITSLPSFGSVTIDGTGKFTYTPSGQNCGTDSFIYQVCNQSSGCCDVATVYIHFGDTQAPIMLNLPADITISCDDEVPAPTQVLAYDACPGIYMEYSEETTAHAVGACETFDVTRTWTATDLCGNMTIGKQVITVQDLTAPEIQRLYTLSNGKKLVSGNAALTSERWKYVSFPITFASVPVVFTQLTTEVENQAATVQLRNVSKQGFELRLTEQEASNGKHLPETVSWTAMEKGTAFNTSFALEAGSIANATSSPTAINFALAFSNAPGLIAMQQTTNEVDAATPRFQNLSSSGAQVFIDEESSKDGETIHGTESLAYLALKSGVDITDVNGDFIGETGTLNLTNAWASFPMQHRYTKPIVIMGGITLNDGDPVTIRVKAVTPTSFQARLQEWTYQDGNHGVEQVTYFILEGSIPADKGYYCEGKASNLVINQNIFAHDNCDNQLSFGQTEVEEMQATGMLTTRTWMAIDDCGKTTIANRNDTCTIAALRLKTILHGAFYGNGGGNLMRDDLRTKGMVPAQEPYTALTTFNHKGKGGGEAVQPSLLLVTGPDAIVDWVFVEVRDSANSALVLATRSALIQRDGDVVTADGSDLLIFPELQEGKYYVAVRHRNHAGIMTDATVQLNSIAPPLVDFTDPNFGIKGWNEAGKVVNGVRMQWAGDFNSDRKVIYQGPSNDIFYLFSRVVADPLNTSNLANFISSGYDRNDMNLDGRTIYQGPGNERATLLYYTVLSHPTNSSYLANFIVREHLP
ncbi:MAG: hypothetical protein K9J37_09750 [Saprospiraceae bacterium]|nr:hypothetical protein [Saprospiraceae bacterium]MCF8250187.1 hypothetical protein [Saprospiraceae bacterium]MCF8281659.1 hypothetical protein [Bacteroidales bacterium]